MLSILQMLCPVLRLDSSLSELVQILLMRQLFVRLRPSGLPEDAETVVMTLGKIL